MHLIESKYSTKAKHRTKIFVRGGLQPDWMVDCNCAHHGVSLPPVPDLGIAAVNQAWHIFLSRSCRASNVNAKQIDDFTARSPCAAQGIAVNDDQITVIVR